MILLDEIEKAHRDIFNILLQVLDDGRLTDSHGHAVDFKNTVLIMTSNIGSQEIIESQQQALPYEAMQNMVVAQVQQYFRPEFLNRVDEMVVFHSLTVDHLKKIVDIQVSGLCRRLKERRISLTLTSGVLGMLAERGYDHVYGARPLKRLIQQEIETPIARLMVKGELQDNGSAIVDEKDGQVTIISEIGGHATC